MRRPVPKSGRRSSCPQATTDGGKLADRSLSLTLSVAIWLLLMSFFVVPLGRNTVTVRCPDGTGCLKTYYFSAGSLLLREVFGSGSLHRLGPPSIAIGVVTATVVSSVVYLVLKALMRGRLM